MRRGAMTSLLLVGALALVGCGSTGPEGPEEEPTVDTIAVQQAVEQIDGVEAAEVAIASDGAPGRYVLSTKVTVGAGIGDGVGPVITETARTVGEQTLQSGENIRSYSFSAVGPRSADDPTAVRLTLSRYQDQIAVGGEYLGSGLTIWRADLEAFVAG